MSSISRLQPSEARNVLPQLIELLKDIIDGGASVGFLPPLTNETAERFWLETIDELEQGMRVLLVSTENGTVTGSAQLALATKQNGVHRAEVQKVMVHSHFRKRGIARALMNEIDIVARELGRTTLVLDTELGSAAESLYANCGYTRVGEIPEFALTTDRSLIATVVFYKLLKNLDGE
jgi:GNAT superfamily N-acetyltransferase